MDAHCGFPLRMPPSFSPVKVCRQVFIPADKNGILVGYTGANFDRLKSYNDHIMLCEKGKRVKRAQDLTSFSGYVWLIGTQDSPPPQTHFAPFQSPSLPDPEYQ